MSAASSVQLLLLLLLLLTWVWRAASFAHTIACTVRNCCERWHPTYSRWRTLLHEIDVTRSDFHIVTLATDRVRCRAARKHIGGVERTLTAMMTFSIISIVYSEYRTAYWVLRPPVVTCMCGRPPVCVARESSGFIESANKSSAKDERYLMTQASRRRIHYSNRIWREGKVICYSELHRSDETPSATQRGISESYRNVRICRRINKMRPHSRCDSAIRSPDGYDTGRTPCRRLAFQLLSTLQSDA